MCGDHDDAVDGEGGELPHLLGQQLRIVSAVADQNAEPHVAGRILDAIHDVRVVRVAEIRQEHSDDASLPPDQRSGPDVRAIAELVSDAQDAFPRRRAHAGIVADRQRHERFRHPRGLRDVDDRCPVAHGHSFYHCQSTLLEGSPTRYLLVTFIS